eukprot:m.226578 g.226578  ORF g.226578 m.226578 type:complete len:1867 (+) comp33495_c0_seq1:230-5830(+)
MSSDESDILDSDAEYSSEGDGFNGVEAPDGALSEAEIRFSQNLPMPVLADDVPFEKKGELLALIDGGEWIKVTACIDAEKISIFRPQDETAWKTIVLQNESDLVSESITERNRKYTLTFFPQLEVLPGYARRSRHITNTLFPFHVKCGQCNLCNEQVVDWKYGSDELFCAGMLLAATSASEMWEWLLAVRWRGRRPPHLGVQQYRRSVKNFNPYTTRDIDPHYDMPRVLQTALFDIMTYSNVEQHSLASRSFALGIMKGAAIHGAEKNFDLILSVNLVDFDRVGRNFNNPLSMCLEGNYSPSRVVIAQKLIEMGATSSDAAGSWANDHPIKMLTKPARITAITSLIGAPVHENDKRLIWQTLIPNRMAIVGKDGVTPFQAMILKKIASDETDEEKQVLKDLWEGGSYRYRDYGSYLTTVEFPQTIEVGQFLRQLRVLNLEDNFLTRFEDSFYDSLPSLEHLNLSKNSIWTISSRVQNLVSLKHLQLEHNCLDGLPSELAKMEKLEECTFFENPILNPPRAIWSQGWQAVKGFFSDMHTHGVVDNTTVKALVVGLSEAGKTSLINALESKDGQAHPTFRGDRTVGIEQRHLSFPRFEQVDSLSNQVFKHTEFRSNNMLIKFGTVSDDSNGPCECSLHLSSYDALDLQILHEDISYDDEGQQELDENGQPVIKQTWRHAYPRNFSVTFTNTSWDPNTRTFEGESFVGEKTKCVAMFGSAHGIDHDLWKVKMVVSEDFEFIDALEIDCVDSNTGSTRHTQTFNGNAFSRDAKVLYDIDLLMYDFAGQEEYYITHHIFLTERALYVLVFDLYKYDPRKTHEKQVLYWAQAIQHRVPGAKLLIVGTHADRIENPDERLAKSERALQQLKNWQNKSRTRLSQKRKKNDKRLEELYKIKKERAAMYVPIDIKVLEDIAKKELSSDETLTDKEEDLLQKFKDVMADEKFREQQPKEETAEMAILHQENAGFDKQLNQLIALPDRIHCVSGVDMLGIKELRKSIEQAATDIPTLGEQIPIAYDQIRNLIANKRMEDRFKCMELDEYCAMVKQELPTLNFSNEAIERATEFLHVIGEVLFYKKHHIVFLNVGYLVDAFKFIIRHDHNEATTYNAEDHASIDVDRRQFQHYKQLLLEQGRLSSVLLQCLWVAPPPYGLGLRKDDSLEAHARYRALVYLLERFDIAAVLEDDEEGDPMTLVVPQFLPDAIPLSAPWTPTCPSETFQLHRLFEFPKQHPRGLMPRLQTRLISMKLMSKIWLSKECVIVPFGECLVLCRISKGDRFASDDDGAFQDMSGLQLIIRGCKTEAVHRACATLIELVKSLIAEWPAERPTHYVVYHVKNSTEKSYAKFDVLKAELDHGYTYHMHGLNQIPLIDLLGSADVLPMDLVLTEEKRNIQQMFSMTGDEGEFLDLDSFVDSVAHDRGVKVIQNYRATSQRWMLLVYEDSKQEFAAQVFEKLTKDGVPCWMMDYAGNFGSLAECYNDGLTHANAVCPIISNSFWDHNRDDFWGKVMESGVPVLPVFADDNLESAFGGVFGKAVDSGKVTQPVLLPDLTGIVTTGDDDPRITELVSRLLDNSLVQKLEEAFSGDNTEKHVKIVRRLSVHRDFKAVAEQFPELSLVQLFRDILRFPQAVTQSYVALFAERYAGDDADELLYYDDQALHDTGITDRTNRIKILDWIHRTKTMRGKNASDPNTTDTTTNNGEMQMPTSAKLVSAPSVEEPANIASDHWVCFSQKTSLDVVQQIVSELEKINIPPHKSYVKTSKEQSSEWLGACLSASVTVCVVCEPYLTSPTCCVEWSNAKRKRLAINTASIDVLDKVPVNQVNGMVKMAIRGSSGDFMSLVDNDAAKKTIGDIALKIKQRILLERPELASEMQ